MNLKKYTTVSGRTVNLEKEETSVKEDLNKLAKHIHKNHERITILVGEKAKIQKQRDHLFSALSHLLQLHLAEQEGLSSGQPTSEQWLKAYDEGVDAINAASDTTKPVK